jgi:hypothetical protein
LCSVVVTGILEFRGLGYPHIGLCGGGGVKERGREGGRDGERVDEEEVE